MKKATLISVIGNPSEEWIVTRCSPAVSLIRTCEGEIYFVWKRPFNMVCFRQQSTVITAPHNVPYNDICKYFNI